MDWIFSFMVCPSVRASPPRVTRDHEIRTAQPQYRVAAQEQDFGQNLTVLVYSLWPFSLMPNPSLKIESLNKAFLFRYWELFKKYFLRNKTFLFFKIKSRNFQHLFETEFCETSQKFDWIKQPIETIEIDFVWMSWMSWNQVYQFLRWR